MRLGGIAAAEDRPGPRVDESDLVLVFAPAAEIGAVVIVDQRKDAAADRDPRIGRMADLLPGGAVRPDLGGLRTWKASPVSSFLSVELCRFIPSFAAQIAMALEPAPHQMRSRRPSEYGSRRSRCVTISPFIKLKSRVTTNKAHES
jgi:hypothetical protein